MDENQLDNPAPQESSDDGEQRLSEFLLGKMDDRGSLELPEDNPEDDAPSAQKAKPETPPSEQKTDEVITPEDPEHEVKINGETKKVKLSELKAGFQKGEDYTAKTERLAAERRETEAARQQAAQERQMYANNLQLLQANLAQAVRSGDISPPDKALIESNPVEYLKQQQRYEDARQMWGQLAQEQQKVQETQRREAEQRYSQTLAEQREQLLAKFPGWSDKAKMQTEVADLKTFLKGEGYKDAEVDGIVDARAVSLAHKAMLYDRLMATKQATESKLRDAPPPRTVRSGTSNAGEATGPRLNQSAMQRVRATGSVDDAARVLRSLMG